MLDRSPDKSMADLRRALPKTWGSPSMSPYCSDEEKYGVIEKIIAEAQADAEAGATILGQKIVDVNTVNGVRMTLEDGSWGLMRASSNTPNLVVVVESPTSEENMIGMFREIERRLAQHPEIGEFDQKI
jgi:phosphomannomutase/phosphoglucomutase